MVNRDFENDLDLVQGFTGGSIRDKKILQRNSPIYTVRKSLIMKTSLVLGHSIQFLLDQFDKKL